LQKVDKAMTALDHSRSAPETDYDKKAGRQKNRKKRRRKRSHPRNQTILLIAAPLTRCPHLLRAVTGNQRTPSVQILAMTAALMLGIRLRPGRKPKRKPRRRNEPGKKKVRVKGLE
jgi:hypothetical protein